MKDKILSILFIVFLTVFMLLNIIIRDKEISTSERRKLKQFPKLNISNILDTSFMEDLDEYTTDQFIFRDNFRAIKANVNYNIFSKLDNNGLYIIDNNIFKIEYPTNKKSIKNFINKINNISGYLSENNNVYIAVIPDKNYYNKDNKYLNIDYNFLYDEIQKLNYNYIELRDILTLNDYYKTDTHWKQENLIKVVNRIGEHLNFKINTTYEKNVIKSFHGVYYGQAAINMPADAITYLTNDIINSSKVYYLEDNKSNDVYTLDKVNSLDKYDIFLNGSSSYIEITNPNSNNTKELVIFRDSFSSSLTPLLIDAYSKITLIDTRYISSDTYLDLIEFKKQDILFLYSTLIINNSTTLKD